MFRDLLTLGSQHVLKPRDRKVGRRLRAPWIATGGREAASAVATGSPRLICMVAVARSGTNHLGATLSRISELDVRHEIFNKTRCQELYRHELAELSRRSGAAFPQACESPETVEAVRRRPDLVMDCLTDLMAPDKRLVYFKVFRLQLSIRQVRYAFITRPDTIVIFLRRRPIDTFISLRKALHVQNWYGGDTTNLKIRIDADDFIGWWGRTSAWFRGVEAACRTLDKPFHRLRYEDDVDVPAEQTLDRFREILASHGVGDLTVAGEQALKKVKRQDRNCELSDRVANWPEFQQRLGDKGFLDKAFQPFPPYEPTRWDRFRYRLSA
ncbi:MAG TPA: sulfotransferase [Dongiaceae bacterium]|nr:sulfotransferase [Dongiaceae bacterium]